MKDIKEYRTVKHWLDRLSPSTQQVQHNFFKRFMNWVGVNGEKFKDLTPDDLIEYQKQADNGNRYELLDTIVQPYVRSTRGTFHTKKSRYSNIRSFFVHNRAELPSDTSFNINPENPPIRGELTPEEIKNCILSCSPMYRALYLCMFQGALDQEMATYWSTNGYDSLVAQLKLDPKVIKIDLPGRKANKNKYSYYTFVASDSVDALKHWMKYRVDYIKRGKIPETSKAIFCNQQGEPIAKRTMRNYWLQRLRKHGYVEPLKRGTRASKTGKGLHEMRTRSGLFGVNPQPHI